MLPRLTILVALATLVALSGCNISSDPGIGSGSDLGGDGPLGGEGEGEPFDPETADPPAIRGCNPHCVDSAAAGMCDVTSKCDDDCEDDWDCAVAPMNGDPGSESESEGEGEGEGRGEGEGEGEGEEGEGEEPGIGEDFPEDGCEDDDEVYNHTHDSAEPLAVGETVTRTVCSGIFTDDWFRVEAAAGEAFSVAVLARSGAVVVRIYDAADGTLLLHRESDEEGDSFVVGMGAGLDDEAFLIRVRSRGGKASYSLTFSVE